MGEAYFAEVERIVRLYLTQKDDLEPVPAKELLDRARKGLVTVLDVGHRKSTRPAICRARSTYPSTNSRNACASCRRQSLSVLPRAILPNVYDAVAMLRRKASRLEVGKPACRSGGSRGFAVERV